MINNQPPVINKQPPVIINQPEKIREINRPNKNSENIHQNIPPVPVNRQPIETQQINTVRPQHIPSPDNKQISSPPVNHTPKIRNQNPVEPREGRREAFQKKENKFKRLKIISDVINAKRPVGRFCILCKKQFANLIFSTAIFFTRPKSFSFH